MTLLGTDPSVNPDLPLPTQHPHVTYAYSKHLWMSNQKEQAFRWFTAHALVRGELYVRFVGNYTISSKPLFNRKHYHRYPSTKDPLTNQKNMWNSASSWLGKANDLMVWRNANNNFLHRCYLRLGQWQESLQGINEQSIPAVLQYYAAATEHDSTWWTSFCKFGGDVIFLLNCSIQ